MKTALITFCATTLVISLSLNIGQASGYIRIASPEQHQETAYMDSQRALMTALVGDAQ